MLDYIEKKVFEINNNKTELSVWIENEKGNKIILSQYIILKVDEYLTLSNIKFDVLLSYQNIPDTRTKYEQGNNVLLDLLCAYDKSTDRKDVLRNSLICNFHYL